MQQVWAMILGLTQRLEEFTRRAKDGSWERSGAFDYFEHPIRELAGLTFGVVGWGELGRAAAGAAAAFGMRVVVANRPGAAHETGRFDLDQVLAMSDVLSLHCPLNEATRGLIGARELALMKPDALLINTARGGLIDSQALAAALKADLCQIYTDVDGVYTADPRIVPGAKKLEEISYDEMLELASLGAKVMQSRSVEFAKKFGVVFEVRSSLNENPGTIVKEETKSMEGVVVRGVSLDKNQAKITLAAVPDRPGVAARIFKALGDATINVDMIVQTASHGSGTPATDISFTLDKADLLKARKVLDAIKTDVGYREAIADEKIGKLSIVGVGMRSHSGVAAKMFECLARAGVNIDMISTSEIKISVVIDLAKGDQATRAVHAAFLE
jgi:lactate dehydrogenase-like 2-hydroxyacid dehydrogenase/predicted amino acid-binding ACT domain protein